MAQRNLSLSSLLPRKAIEFTQATRNRLFPVLSNYYVMVFITIVPVLTLFAIINLLPIIWAFWASLHKISIISPDWQWVGLENFVDVLTDDTFWATLRRSVVFAAGSVFVQILFGTFVALVINRSFKFNKLVRGLVMLPYLIPTTIVAILSLWMANSQWGIINWALIDLGILSDPHPWFGDPGIAMPMVILVNSWKFSIFVTIMVLARLQIIDESLYEAATIVGANSYEKFRDITWPNIRGVILLVILLRGIWMFNKFDIIYVTTRGGPGQATTTAPIYAFEVSFDIAQLGEGAAISVLLFFVLFFGAIIYFIVFEPEQEVRVE